MTEAENELLTRTGPGTPCGEMMRRYWQPAALSEELPASGAPLPVRLLSEDLVLFRDEQGRAGLLGLHCEHRGADLSYGRVEDGGLRCIYHGWLYDRLGRVIDMPGEAEGGARIRDSICHLAYPCEERAGVIFAYMGSGEPPLLPNYEFLTVPEERVFATKLFHDCNQLQAVDGTSGDLIHLSFLHHQKSRDAGGPPDAKPRFSSRGVAAEKEQIEIEIRDFGLRVCKVRKMGDKKHLYLGTFLPPSIFTFLGNADAPQTLHDGYSVNWHVPIDDTCHWKYTIIFNRNRALDKGKVALGRTPMTPDYKPLRNKGNRYMQNRYSLAEESYTGIPDFQSQDLCVWEGAGTIQDRTQEHIVSSDLAVVAGRKILLKAIHDVQQGRDAPYLIRQPASNRFKGFFVYEGTVASMINWKDHLAQLEAEAPR